MMALINARNEASQDEHKVPRVITALGPVPAFTNILASGGVISASCCRCSTGTA